MTTTKAATKRAERERRRANGEVRVECWLTREDVSWLMQPGCTLNDAIADAVRYHRDHCMPDD